MCCCFWAVCLTVTDVVSVLGRETEGWGKEELSCAQLYSEFKFYLFEILKLTEFIIDKVAFSRAKTNLDSYC